jgi:integrase
VLENLHDPHRTMAIIAMCLGLRVSEILGLQWPDFDWDDSLVHVQRSVVVGRQDETKTVGSEKRLPIHEALAAEESSGIGQSGKCPGFHGYSQIPIQNVPWMAHTIQQNYLIPAGKAAKVGWIGWHTFRHSYSTQLRALGVDVKGAAGTVCGMPTSELR